MKKILMLMVVALTAISVKAISIDEAYTKLTKISGATLCDVPEYDRLKEGMDWGKIVMFTTASPATIAQIKQVFAEITDPMVANEKVQGMVVSGYAAKQKNGRTRCIYCTIAMSDTDVSVVAIYCQGGDDIISGMNTN